MGKMDKIQMLMNDLNAQLQQQGYTNKNPANGPSCSSTSKAKECWTPETMVSAAIGTSSSDGWPSQNFFRSSWSIQDNIREFWYPSKERDNESLTSTQAFALQENEKNALRKSRRRRRRIITLFAIALLIAILVMVVLVYTMYKNQNENVILVNNSSTSSTHSHHAKKKSNNYDYTGKTRLEYNNLEQQYKNLVVMMEEMQKDMNKYKNELVEMKSLYAECKSSENTKLQSTAVTNPNNKCQEDTSKENQGTSDGIKGRSPKALQIDEKGIESDSPTAITTIPTTKSVQISKQKNTKDHYGNNPTLDTEERNDANIGISTFSAQDVLHNVPTTEKIMEEFSTFGDVLLGDDKATQVAGPLIQDLKCENKTNDKDDTNSGKENKNERNKNPLEKSDIDGHENEGDKNTFEKSDSDEHKNEGNKNTFGKFDNDGNKTALGKSNNDGSKNEGNKYPLGKSDNDEYKNENKTDKTLRGDDNFPNQNKETEGAKNLMIDSTDIKDREKTEKQYEHIADESQNKKLNHVNVVAKDKEDGKGRPERPENETKKNSNNIPENNENFPYDPFSDDNFDKLAENNDSKLHIHNGQFWQDLDEFLKSKNRQDGVNDKNGVDEAQGTDNPDNQFTTNPQDGGKSSLDDQNDKNAMQNDGGNVGKFREESDPIITDKRKKRKKKSKWRFFQCIYEYVSKKIGNYPKDFELTC